MAILGRRNVAATRGTGLALVILGILAMLAGIVALFFPGLTLLNLVLIFGWFAVITGAIEMVHAFTGDRSFEGRTMLALWGLVTVVAGLIALIVPAITLGSFVLLIAIYFFVTGIAQIVAAFRGHLHGWLLLWGVLGVLAGIGAVAYPGAVAFTLAVIFAVYAILGGLSALSAGIAILTGHQQPTVFSYSHRRAG